MIELNNIVRGLCVIGYIRKHCLCIENGQIDHDILYISFSMHHFVIDRWVYYFIFRLTNINIETIEKKKFFFF